MLVLESILDNKLLMSPPRGYAADAELTRLMIYNLLLNIAKFSVGETDFGQGISFELLMTSACGITAL
jgi:hypothetical protein